MDNYIYTLWGAIDIMKGTLERIILVIHIHYTSTKGAHVTRDQLQLLFLPIMLQCS